MSHGFSPRMGSSPRMRGSQTWASLRTSKRGIIPAHAGLTFGASDFSVFSGDHPRACGAHSSTSSFANSMEGSSPRMRGSPIPPGQRIASRGIIPAHAGLTLHHCSSHCHYRDHPRACGAHSSTPTLWSSGVGSSPRMRGSLLASPCTGARTGIIPAHAGLTGGSIEKSNFSRDHPRACGAHQPHRCC